MRIGSLLLAGLLVTMSANATKVASGPVKTRTVYGEDNRLELFEVQNAVYLKWARATAALIPKSRLRDLGTGASLLVAPTLAARMRLCEGEPFREQLTAATCTGFLVAPTILVTAGHCVVTQDHCASMRFAFGYGVQTPGGEPRALPHSQIYSCKQLIRTEATSGGSDFAVVQLDRPVADRTPLVMGASGQLKVDDKLVVLSHPSGIPIKVDDGGRVRDLNGSTHFQAAVDTYGGSSGAPIISAQSGHVVGVLVRGDADYVSVGECNVSKHCEESGCRGEDVTRIEEVRKVLGL